MIQFFSPCGKFWIRHLPSRYAMPCYHYFQEKETGELNLTSFSRENLDDTIKFLKENCFVRKGIENEKPKMYTTGIGGFQYAAKFENELHVR